MQHAYFISPNLKLLFSSMSALKTFNTATCHSLEYIAECLEKNNHYAELRLPNFQALKEAILVAIKILPPEDIIYANGFLFCAEILVKRIEMLHEVVMQI